MAAIGGDLKRQLPSRAVRWVKPANMHLTLRFLGETAESQIDPIAHGLQTALANVSSFSLVLSQLGAFPNKNRPRVIWVGVGGELKRLHAVQASVESALAQLGWLPDRLPFKPHLTIGRVKKGNQFKGVKWGGRVEQLPILVTAVHLIKSDQQPTGPIYTKLHTIKLTS